MDIRIVEFVNKHLGNNKVKGAEIQVDKCPFCGREKKKFFINTEKGVYQCFSGSCRETGHISALYKKFGEEFNLEIKGSAPIKDLNKYIKPTNENIVNFFKTRGISKETLKKNFFDVMSTEMGDVSFIYRKNFDIHSVKIRSIKEKRFAGKKIKDLCLWKLDFADIEESLIITEGECFPGYVEVFTESGWIKFENLKNEKVFQVKKDMTGDFVNPEAYIKKYYNDDLVCLKNKRNNYKSITTKNHNLVYIDKKNEISKKKAIDFCKGIVGKIPTSVNLDGKGTGLTKDEIALRIAISADGSIKSYRKTLNCYYVHFGFKKQRKIDRLEGILKRLNVKYNKNVKKGGYTYINIWTDINTKLFPDKWLIEMSLEERLFFIEEIVHWDGNKVNNRKQYEFSSINYEQSKFIQTIAHTCGYMSTITKRKNSFGEWYKTSILLNKNSVTWQNNKKTTYEKYNDFVYCVTVPTGMILTRTEGSINVTGNCDALSFEEQGINNVVSVPAGAGTLSWIDTDYEELEKFKTIILAFDNDEAGKDAVEKIIKRMPEEVEIKIIDFSPYKDANEALLAGENLKKYVDSAQVVEDESIVKFEDIDIDTPVKRMSTGSLYLNRAIGGIRPGELNIFTGQGGSGKSTALNQIMLNVLKSGVNCLIYTPELTDVQYKKWTCRQLLTDTKEESTTYFDDVMQRTYYLPKPEVSKKMSKWVDKKLTYITSEKNMSEKEVLKGIIKNIKKKDVKFIVLDNLMKISFDTKTMEELYEKQKLFIEDLSKICKNYNVSINLVAHPKKHETSEPDQYIIMGTSNIPNLVDNIYYYKRITEHSLKTVFKDQKEYIQQKNFSSAFMVLKSREGEKIGEWLFLNFDPIIKHFYFCDEGKKIIDNWKSEEIEEIIKLEDIPEF